MRYTSLELSKKLHEAFPEWDDTKFHYQKVTDQDGQTVWLVYYGNTSTDDSVTTVPAYDTDYLLEKLRRSVSLHYQNKTKEWWANDVSTHIYKQADIPSEALGLLALSLKEKGLL